MDKFGAANVRLVLITLIVLTLGTFGVMLYLVLDGKDVPTLIVGTSTTLLGLLTGTAVSITAPPRVDAAQRAAADMAYEVRSAAEIPTVAAPVLAPATEELGDEGAPPEGEKNLSPE